MTLDGTPLNVFSDGIGALQVRIDGLAAGLFYDPDENPGHAGLEIREGDAIYPLQDGFETGIGRLLVEPQTVVESGPGTRTLHTAYTVGPHLRVSEDVTYTDGTSQILVHYGITNISPAPVSIRAAELADLYVGANDNGNGVISNVAPRFVGGRDEATGLVYGLQEITPWAGLQEGDFELVFTNFAASALNNTVDSEAPDNGVGVEWVLDNIAPGETRAIDVRWLLASPAPPGTESPKPLGRRRRHHPCRRTASCRRRSRARASTPRSARARSASRCPARRRSSTSRTRSRCRSARSSTRSRARSR